MSLKTLGFLQTYKAYNVFYQHLLLSICFITQSMALGSASLSSVKKLSILLKNDTVSSYLDPV